MEQPPPLTPEEVYRQSHLEYAHLGRPTVVTIFSLLHVVFGVIGILINLLLFAPVGFDLGSLKSIVSILMVIAGLKMFLKQPDGLRFSNIYAWCSIGTIVWGIGLNLSEIFPIAATADSHDYGFGTRSSFIEIAALLGKILFLTYPITCLILLNQSKIKDWFASLEHPEI